jgi:putative Mn2+ efflux pump MntP
MTDQKPGRATVSERDARYDDIEGGVSPSPFTSIILAVAFASALAAAAIGETMGETGARLWDLAAITGVIAVILAAFAPSGE